MRRQVAEVELARPVRLVGADRFFAERQGLRDLRSLNNSSVALLGDRIGAQEGHSYPNDRLARADS